MAERTVETHVSRSQSPVRRWKVRNGALLSLWRTGSVEVEPLMSLFSSSVCPDAQTGGDDAL